MGSNIKDPVRCLAKLLTSVAFKVEGTFLIWKLRYLRMESFEVWYNLQQYKDKRWRPPVTLIEDGVGALGDMAPGFQKI